MTEQSETDRSRAAVGWLAVLAQALRAFVVAAGDPQRLASVVAERVAETTQSLCVVGFLETDSAWGACSAFDPAEPRLASQAELRDLLAELPASSALPSRLGQGSSELNDLPEPPRFFEQRGGDRCVAAWLYFAGDLLGVILVAQRIGAEPLSSTQRDLLWAFAERAGIARHHGLVLASAHQEVNERHRLAERLRALAEASSAFAAATVDYRTLLDVVARTTGRILGEVCAIRLISPDGEWLRREDASVYHPDPEVVEYFERAMVESPQRLGQGWTGQVAATGQAYFEPRVNRRKMEGIAFGAYRTLIEKVEVASVMVVPVMAPGRCLGALSVTRSSTAPPYDLDDLQLLRDIADRAALAVQNSRLLRDLERRIVEVQKGEEKFRQLLESAPDAMVIIDELGHIVLINAQTEELFGYTRGELLGQRVEVLIPREYREHHPDLRAKYSAAPRVRHAMAAGLDLAGQRKDGTQFWAEINLSPIRTAEGNLVTAVIRDVTDRKRLEEARARTQELEALNRRAEEANRLKSEFLANMSHELRTPLNAVIGFSSLLHTGKAGPLSATQTEYLGDILTSSRHLLQLINDVLDLAKVEAGRTEVKPERVDVNRVVAEVRDTLRAVAVEKGVSLHVEVAPTLPGVVTDPRLLKQVLYNFLSNALKFGADAGTVRVAVTAEPPGYFTIAVKDDGIGIASEDLPRLFREFQQLDSGASKRYGGTGLGLALTKRIVEAQGGSVAVASTPGGGAVFSATLPTAPVSPPTGRR